jgi:hypothetical protein
MSSEGCPKCGTKEGVILDASGSALSCCNCEEAAIEA